MIEDSGSSPQNREPDESLCAAGPCMDEAKINIKEIRDLARKFTPEQMEKCIAQQIEAGKNVCREDGSTEAVVNELAKAEFVRTLVDEGESLDGAVRELARRIRLIQNASKKEGIKG